MSRAQQGETYKTAQEQQADYNQKATGAFDTAQQDVNTYGGAVGKFEAANPYVQGGAFETATNQADADTAAGMAASAGQGIQSAAVRTGQNAGGAIAATEKMQQQNERDLMAQRAKNTEARVAGEAGYGQAVLGARSNQAELQDRLAREQQEASQGNLNVQEEAAKTPSFMDMLGQGIIQAGSNVAGTLAGKIKV